MKKIFLSIFLFFALVNITLAGEISVRTSIEPSEILIGEQASLKIELTQDKDEKVSWPQFSDTIATNVSIIEKLATDTISLPDNRISITSEYLVSSYDSGFYYIPEFVFETTSQKVTSNPVGLTVNTVQVNEQTDDIHAEKDIMSAPFSWIELAQWSGIGLAIILIIAIIVLLLMRFVFKKKVTIIPEEPEVILPAHVVALEKLEQIKTEKIWQQGQIKQFYTQLTDVIREYLSRAYSINAMEMTTDEIVALVKKNKDLDEIRIVLKEMLELSDLVKFAKFIPLENENEKAVLDAFMIVEKTTKEPEVEEKQETEKTSEE
jgi:hypothetical protein